MTTSEKQKSNIFSKQFKNTQKSTFKDGQRLSNCHDMHECRRPKRLRSHRERNRMRGCGKTAPKLGAQPQQGHRGSTDRTRVHSCCHHSRRNAPPSGAVAAAKEPSVITENRLIGHQGLFNHEVKSIDIERLLSEQRKMEKSQWGGSAAAHWSSAPHGSVAGDMEKSEHQEVGASRPHDELRDKEKGQIQRLAPTLEDGPHPVLSEPSSESCNSPFSAPKVKVRTAKIRNAQHLTPVTDGGTKLACTAQRGETRASDRNTNDPVSPEEGTPKKQACPGLRSQTYSLSPVEPPSSRSAENIDVHHPSPEPGGGVARSVATLAAALCHRLKFPFLKQRSLVEESRQVLLNALQERVGPPAQENLLQGWSCGSRGAPHQEEATGPKGMRITVLI